MNKFTIIKYKIIKIIKNTTKSENLNQQQSNKDKLKYHKSAEEENCNVWVV